MPRKARVDTPGALHHIIIREIERKPIFKDKIDYANFIDRLGKIIVATCIACFAWALITCSFPIQIGGCGFIYPDEEIRSEARSLFCYWSVRELGISGTHLAKRLGMSQSGVVYAVNKGEKAAKEKNYQLVV